MKGDNGRKIQIPVGPDYPQAPGLRKGERGVGTSGALQYAWGTLPTQGSKEEDSEGWGSGRPGCQTLLIRTLRALPSLSVCSLNASSNLSFSGSP